MIDTNRYMLNHNFQRIHFETLVGGSLIAASLLGGTTSIVTATEKSIFFSFRAVAPASPA
jgi:hypothetical protein